MTIEQVVAAVRSFDGAVVLAPGPGDEAPEIAWGDFFFYYAPDGQVPRNQQPYGTIVTKDYPGDTESALDGEGRWRVNIHVGTSAFRELTGEDPRDETVHQETKWDFAAPDVVMPHPVYRSLGWVSVVVPGEETTGTVIDLLRAAHAGARARALRRGPRPNRPD